MPVVTLHNFMYITECFFSITRVRHYIPVKNLLFYICVLILFMTNLSAINNLKGCFVLNFEVYS